MGLVEDNLLRIEAKVESYLPIFEVMSIVNSSEHRDMDLVANVMDSLGMFSLTAYKQTGMDYEPDYEAIGVGYELKQKIKDFGNAQLIFRDNSACFEEFYELRQYISRHLWSRLDLLKIERLVEHTGLVSWGEHDALCFMYSEMVNSKDSEYHKLPKISKQAIDDYLNLGNYQRKLINRGSYSPEEIICLMTNEDPDYINHDDKYLVYWDIIKAALESNQLTPLKDSQDIEAEQVKKWLKDKGLFYRKPDSNSLEQPTTISSMKRRIDELEAQISNQKVDKKDTVIIPFLKRIDCISKDLPQSERIKQSYEIYSNDISFYEDTHTVNSPDEMIKRIQGLLKVVRGKDNKIRELEKQTNTRNNVQDKIDELENQLAQAKAKLADKPAVVDNDKNPYVTPAINIMNAVIAEFWINYDPSNPAPKQSTITDWITNNFEDISDALALNIDKVCRHTSARSGGKYKR